MQENKSPTDAEKENRSVQTLKDSGWHQSRYNLFARVPGTNMTAAVNLYKGICASLSLPELYLYSEAENLPADHPIFRRFRDRGLIANHDEREALYAAGRISAAFGGAVNLTIAPTMGCNFDCPYCFEKHRAGKMSRKVQEDVSALAERMLKASGAKAVNVTWFGGEPLLAKDVVGELTEKLLAVSEKYGASYRADIITNGYLLDRETVDLLERAKVDEMQITIDGLQKTHDATRHLSGGGGTFERIVQNLRTLHIPFPVNIRQNLHEGNNEDRKPLEALVRALSEESGNDLNYTSFYVRGNRASRERDSGISFLQGRNRLEEALHRDAGNFHLKNGRFCGASRLYSVGIDEEGRLFKCWENIDDPELSFGTADKWDPIFPFQSASMPDQLTRFLNTAPPFDDEECMNCVWLPVCYGGCPIFRLNGEKECVAYKNDPEAYVLALYRRMTQEQKEQKQE